MVKKAEAIQVYSQNENIMLGLLPLLFYYCFSLSCLPADCPGNSVPSTQRGNGICDLGCMTKPCSFDSQASGSDCLSTCSLACPVSGLGNHTCDPGTWQLACNTQECGWDFGDCGYCAKDCKR